MRKLGNASPLMAFGNESEIDEAQSSHGKPKDVKNVIVKCDEKSVRRSRAVRCWLKNEDGRNDEKIGNNPMKYHGCRRCLLRMPVQALAYNFRAFRRAFPLFPPQHPIKSFQRYVITVSKPERVR